MPPQAVKMTDTRGKVTIPCISAGFLTCGGRRSAIERIVVVDGMEHHPAFGDLAVELGKCFKTLSEGLCPLPYLA